MFENKTVADLEESSVGYRPFPPTPIAFKGKVYWVCWVGTVRAEMNCFKLHSSRDVAIRCAERWCANNPHKPMHYRLSAEEEREHSRQMFVLPKELMVVKGTLRVAVEGK